MTKKLLLFLLGCLILCSIMGCSQRGTVESGDTSVLPIPTNDASTAGSGSTPSETRYSSEERVSATSTIESKEEVPVLLTLADTVSSTKPAHLEATSSSEGNNNTDGKCRLVVRGKDITTGNYVQLNTEYRYAELPFTAVMEGLGANVTWESDTIATIAIEGRNYILDMAKGTLVEEGGTFNIFVVSPGSRHSTSYQVIGNEFVIDSDSVTMLLNGRIGVRVIIDFEKELVEIG